MPNAVQKTATKTSEFKIVTKILFKIPEGRTRPTDVHDEQNNGRNDDHYSPAQSAQKWLFLASRFGGFPSVATFTKFNA
jgi:hypothetical protein